MSLDLPFCCLLPILNFTSSYSIMAYEILSPHMHKKKMWIPLVNYYFITPTLKIKKMVIIIIFILSTVIIRFTGFSMLFVCPIPGRRLINLWLAQRMKGPWKIGKAARQEQFVWILMSADHISKPCAMQIEFLSKPSSSDISNHHHHHCVLICLILFLIHLSVQK